MKNYITREGDTFLSVSKYYYKTDKIGFFLALINGCRKNEIKEGERIFVPNKYNIAFVISMICTIASIAVLLIK